tara:strand:- start:153 stop:473 length:321 start_codon:yes stop_codon:yes gene_type:complete
MTKLKADNLIIEARQVVEGIPVDPVHPPSMKFVDPHRRWLIETERVWLRRPWIVSLTDGYEIYNLRPTSYRPEIWGQFETLQQAVDYILNPPPSAPIELNDYDMDF